MDLSGKHMTSDSHDGHYTKALSYALLVFLEKVGVGKKDSHKAGGNGNKVQTGTVISGSLSPRHGASSGCGWRNGLQIWKVAANILNKQSRTADKGWSSSFRVGQGANNPSP
jgi:hypothetical protein